MLFLVAKSFLNLLIGGRKVQLLRLRIKEAVSPADVPVQTRWSYFSAFPLHSTPMSMSLPQHIEGVLPSQFSHGSTIEQSTGNRFQESSSSTASDNSRNFSMETGATITQFPDELGLMDTLSTTTTRVSANRLASYSSTIMSGKAQSVVTKNLSRSTVTNTGDSNNSNNNNQSMSASGKTHSTQ